jgi:hypothetical protein
MFRIISGYQKRRIAMTKDAPKAFHLEALRGNWVQATGKRDVYIMRLLASDIGRSLADADKPSLSALQDQLARASLKSGPGDDFAEGFRTAIEYVLSGASSALTQKENDRLMVREAIEGGWRPVLEALEGGALTFHQLAGRLPPQTLPKAQEMMGELEDRGLVEGWKPENGPTLFRLSQGTRVLENLRTLDGTRKPISPVLAPR